jgi:death-on-curing family protein
MGAVARAPIRSRSAAGSNRVPQGRQSTNQRKDTRERSIPSKGQAAGLWHTKRVSLSQQSFGGQYLHKDIFEMAAAYAFHVAESQAFVDGNKRTGLAAAYIVLGLNGFRLIEQDDRLYEAMIAIGTRRMDKAGLAQVLRELSVAEE